MKEFTLQITVCTFVISACALRADLSSDCARVAAEWQRQIAWRGGRFPTSEIGSVALMLQNALSKGGHTNTIVPEHACGADHNVYGDATPRVVWSRESAHAILQMFLAREQERSTHSSKPNTLYDYDLMWCMFDKSFCEQAFDHYLSMCTNYALHDDSRPHNVISVLASAIQRHALCMSNSVYLDALMDTAEHVISDMIQTTNMRAVLVRLHTINVMPEDASARGQCVPAAYLIRRFERTTLLPARAWLIMRLSDIATREALDYCAAHGAAAYRMLDCGPWDEFLEEYRERVAMAEMRNVMCDGDGRISLRAKQVHVEHAQLTNTLAVLRMKPSSRTFALRYWNALKKINARSIEWNAADIVYDSGTFHHYATNCPAACITDVLMSEVSAQTSTTSQASYVAYSAASLLGMYLTKSDVPSLVTLVNHARPMRVLKHDTHDQRNMMEQRRVELFFVVVMKAVEHQRQAALEALAAQVHALRDPWVRETVSKMLEHAKISVPTHAPPAKTDCFNVE